MVLLTVSTGVFAQHHGGHHNHHNQRGGWHWGPVISGAVLGAVVYDIYNRPVVVKQPVVVQNIPMIYQTRENCTPWIETQNYDGTITRTRTCNQ